MSEQKGATLIEMFRKDLDSLRAQELRSGREIVAVLNHPNFLWSQTAEDLLALPDLRFFEVYNGHPLVNILGDSLRPGTERIWDIVLTRRLTSGGEILYGVATDDAHDYHTFAPAQRNPGRGWIMVRSSTLAPDSLMRAMERGDFYASTGVTLAELRREGARLTLSIKGEPGVSYTTQFIGTRRGYDTVSVAVTDSAGAPVTRRYSSEVGTVLSEQRGTTATYVMRGDEIYVRARITSSKPKANFSYAGRDGNGLDPAGTAVARYAILPGRATAQCAPRRPRAARSALETRAAPRNKHCLHGPELNYRRAHELRLPLDPLLPHERPVLATSRRADTSPPPAARSSHACPRRSHRESRLRCRAHARRARAAS